MRIFSTLLFTFIATIYSIPINDICPSPETIIPDNWNCHNVSGFLDDWWLKHEFECRNQPFYSCFANSFKWTIFQCDTIGGICDPGQLMNWQNSTESYYVIVAISNIHQYYMNMYNAMNSASLIINELLPDLIHKLDPPRGGTSLVYKEFANAFATIVGLIPNPWEDIGKSINGIWQGINLKLNTVVDKTFIDFGKMDKELGVITSTAQDEISNRLMNIMNNYTEFSNLVQNGWFLYGNYIHGNTSEPSFKKLFQSYLQDKMISMILRSKNMYAVVIPDSKSISPPGQWDSQTHSYWTSPNLNIFHKPNFPVWYLSDLCQNANNYKNLDKVLFENHDALTTPEKVFDPSWKCQNETGKLGGGSNEKNSTNLNDCLYNIPVCILSKAPDYTDKFPQYKNCPSDCE